VYKSQGQWHPLVKYYTAIPYGFLALESDALHYVMANPQDYNSISKWQHDHPTLPSEGVLRMNSVRMRFMGQKFAPRITHGVTQNYYYNYFIGEEEKWASGVHPSSQVLYEGVYNGINLRIDGRKTLKYQWEIQSPTKEVLSQIKMKIEGASKIEVSDRVLLINTPNGQILDSGLFVFQQVGDALVELNAHYVLKDSFLTYEILGDINPDYKLIIDPELIFSTYSGATGDNFGYTATYDSKANLYAGGMVKVIPALNERYPVTSGAFDNTYNGGAGSFPCDVSISKYDSAGTSLLWASYIGGQDNEFPHSLVVDRNDDLIILGTTSSDNFATTSQSFDTSYNGSADILSLIHISEPTRPY